ncbi:formin-like protein 13 [Musa acuminata AAA Group]|uniref:formin-like protein 13 n=1 Tax=Musa acuminata AAA Group TaxID=214697 RepID=UPI0031D553DD
MPLPSTRSAEIMPSAVQVISVLDVRRSYLERPRVETRLTFGKVSSFLVAGTDVVATTVTATTLPPPPVPRNGSGGLRHPVATGTPPANAVRPPLPPPRRPVAGPPLPATVVPSPPLPPALVLSTPPIPRAPPTPPLEQSNSNGTKVLIIAQSFLFLLLLHLLII